MTRLTKAHSKESPKPGIATTEFLLSVLVLVCATVLVALGRLDADRWALVAGVNGAGYALSRGLAKSG